MSSQFRLFPMVAMLAFAGTAYGETLALDQALTKALGSNPAIAARKSLAQAEESLIRSNYSLENPRFGLMRESNMTPMEQNMGPMSTWSISQPIRFPTKYFLMGSAQSSKAKAADQEQSATRLEVRQKLVTAYFGLFTINRVLELLEAQRETLKQVARSAESRHAVGTAPQQDEMKAHVEQTKIETEIISAQEERAMVEASLNALMGNGADSEISLPKKDLEIPTLKVLPSEIGNIANMHSPQIKAARFLAESEDTKKSLAGWEFAPDFMLTYKRAYSNAPPDAYSVGVEISLPLWFFTKQTGEYRAAAQRSAAAEKSVDLKRLNTSADVKSLTAKVVSHEKLLQIYKTALIPQATTALSSSEGAYRAGKTTFLELLDSERSLYMVRIAYYRTLSQYIDDLTRLEEVTGSSLSELPMGDSL
jgi:cobalt-zinc-cadmium efflux system outer membrane protein